MRHWIALAALALPWAACVPSAEIADEPPARVAAGELDLPGSAPAKEKAPPEGAKAVRFGGSLCLVLDGLFNNDAIASEARPRDGNFDIPERRNGDTFPWKGMPEGGKPFTSGRVEGVTFVFPRYSDGMTNNVACRGQTIRLDPADHFAPCALHVLGASEADSQEAEITLVAGPGGEGVEGDGSVEGGKGGETTETRVPFRLTDWCQRAKYGEVAVLRWGYRMAADGWRDGTPCSIFVQTIDLPHDTLLRGLRLPDNPRMHVFALTLQDRSRAVPESPPADAASPGAAASRPEGAPADALTGTVRLADTSDRQPQRWEDIAGNAYSAAFNAGFSYADADVRVTYRKRGDAFTGRLAATGLKPNFAYQVKLIGDRADERSFETIGRLGRWLIDTADRTRTNFDDADYEERKNDPEVGIESYLLFDYFVTDDEGKATKALRLDSSFHVMWNRELNRWSAGPRPEDSALFEHTFTPDSKVYWWDVPADEVTVGLWLEQEWVNRRPAKGQVKLPAGTYRAAIQLTEESFHESRPGWARVLQGPVLFEIVAETEAEAEPATEPEAVP